MKGIELYEVTKCHSIGHSLSDDSCSPDDCAPSEDCWPVSSEHCNPEEMDK